MQRENDGLMAEWLGKGLQNLVQRFESASDLLKMGYIIIYPIFCLDLFLILFVKTDALYWMKGVGPRSFAGVFSGQLPVMRAADRIVREQSVRE